MKRDPDSAGSQGDGFDEFEWIDRLRPLTQGDPRALDLKDDAAVIPGRPGFELVISKDAMVAGVHFLEDEPGDRIAKRLLRTSLSDLAAKAAQPFGYFLMAAWPDIRGRLDREAFIRGLMEDGETFQVALLGGDTVRTPGPLTLSATVLGWRPSGQTLARSGARAGDVVMICGVIGDGWLGLKAARGEVADLHGRLATHYRTPEPLLKLRSPLSAYARAAADVSDGLIADALNVAQASGLGLSLDLGELPLSEEAVAWLGLQADEGEGRLALAAGGDDYAIVCAIAPDQVDVFARTVAALGAAVSAAGLFTADPTLVVRHSGRTLEVKVHGYRH